MEIIKEDHEDSHHHQQDFHVLAVDDSLIDRKLLEKLLTISSYHVTCVDSGSKALEYLGLPDNLDNSTSSTTEQQRAVNVNLIITDYCMPGMSGYDLLRRVKKSSWKDVPVVVMSSENVPSRISRCLEGGAEEFLLKPVQLSDMKRLQPHLLKSLNSTSNNNNINTTNNSSNNNNNNNNTTNNSSNNNNNNNNNTTNSSNNNSSSNNNKRKAMSPPPNERRPKCRSLTVV